MERIGTGYKLANESFLWLLYLMYLLVIPALIAVVFNYIAVRRLRSHNGAQLLDAVMESDELIIWSHHEWLRRTFFVGALGAMVAAGTVFMGAGVFVSIVLMAWWWYRVVRGMWTLAFGRSLPVAL